MTWHWRLAAENSALYALYDILTYYTEINETVILNCNNISQYGYFCCILMKQMQPLCPKKSYLPKFVRFLSVYVSVCIIFSVIINIFGHLINLFFQF